MLTGKRFRLKTATVGIEKVDDERVAVLVPADIIIEVTGGPRPSDMRMVDVLWEGKALAIRDAGHQSARIEKVLRADVALRPAGAQLEFDAEKIGRSDRFGS